MPSSHELFVKRWADRYTAIRTARGELAARSWAKSFLNEGDRPRVVEELNRRAEVKK